MQRSAWSVKCSLVAGTILLLFIFFSLSLLFPAWNSSKCRVSDVTKSSVSLDKLSKFHQTFNSEPLCHQLPDASAAYIWSQLKVSWMKLQRPFVMMQQLQNSPSPTQIQRLANRISIGAFQNKPMEVLILLSQAAEADIDWAQRLQRLVNDALAGVMRVQVSAAVLQDEHHVLELATKSDIVVDCRGADEMQHLATQFQDLTVLPNAIHYLHSLKQSRILSLLKMTTNPPLLILVAEAPKHSNSLSSSVYSRTIQRLAHWYQLGYIVKDSNERNNLDQTLGFAILKWLVDYCSSPLMQDTKALLPGVQQLVEKSMRPPLELATSWKRVSKEWNNMRGQAEL